MVSLLMDGRIGNTLEFVIFVAICLGVFWIVGFFCKSTFGFEMRTELGYKIVLFGAIAIRILLIQLLVNN